MTGRINGTAFLGLFLIIEGATELQLRIPTESIHINNCFNEQK